jgi:hypothetical protein
VNTESPVARAVRIEREAVEQYLRDLSAKEKEPLVSFVLNLAAEHVRRGLHEAVKKAEDSNVIPFR